MRRKIFTGDQILFSLVVILILVGLFGGVVMYGAVNLARQEERALCRRKLVCAEPGKVFGTVDGEWQCVSKTP